MKSTQFAYQYKCLLIMTALLLVSRQVQGGETFFQTLNNLCGHTFIGKMTFPEKGMSDFQGKSLVAKIASCSESQILIPFHVGEDHSRTWILTNEDDGLLFKHQHIWGKTMGTCGRIREARAISYT